MSGAFSGTGSLAPPCRLSANLASGWNGTYFGIVSVCALPYDPSLVAVTVEFQTPFTFTGVEFEIYEVGDRTGSWNPPFVSGATGQAQIPFTSAWRRQSQDFIYDFGAVIHDYLEATPIKFRMTFKADDAGMYSGEGEQVLTYSWDKGLYFKPLFFKRLAGGYYAIYYQIYYGTTCPCEIWCEAPRYALYSGVFDPPPPYLCRLPLAPMYPSGQSGAAKELSVVYHFGDGLRGRFAFWFLADMEPEPPEVGQWGDGVRVYIPWRDKYHTPFSGDVQVRVERYEKTESNITVVKDWTPLGLDYIYDYPLKEGVRYGYRVRYIGQIKDKSLPSDWTEIVYRHV